jgi:hypothetical protein
VSPSEPRMISVAEHPRAGASVRRAKSWGGLLAFALMLAAGMLGGVDLGTALGRAVVGGMVGYLATWAAALAIWRHLLRAEAKAVLARVRARNSERANHS